MSESFREAVGINEDRYEELSSQLARVFARSENKSEVFNWIKDNDDITKPEALFLAYKFGGLNEFLNKTQLSDLIK